MHRRFNIWTCCLLLLCLAIPASMSAQGVQATLTGRVSDASGAAVPGVPVQIKNVETNQVTRETTDSVGLYTAPFLQPGLYSVTVELSGFKKFVLNSMVLNVSQTAQLDIALEVGALSDQVTVSGAAEMLETAKADRGTLIDTESVAELPLNGRNPFMLARTAAGVNFNGQYEWERPFDNGAIAAWTINGGLESKNEFLLDGSPNEAQAGSNNVAYVPMVDAVQEFKIQTNSYDAQYGHTGGGIINVSLKSGTNALHGTGYEFLRRNALDANSFQNNAQGEGRSGHYLDQYGGQLAGPVYIPKIYDGRNKTFFLFAYEKYREGTPRPQTLSVPAPEFLTGNFGNLVDGNGQKITIYDPTTTVQNASGAYVRTPFSGNLIPGSRLNPIAQKILSYFPAPNTSTPSAGYSQSNYFFGDKNNIDRDNFYNEVAKIDQQIGSYNHFFVRQLRNNRLEEGYDNGNAIIGVGQNGSLPEIRTNDGISLDWVSILSPKLVLDVRLSFNRYLGEDRGDANAGFDMTKLGLPQSLVSELPGGAFFGNYNISNYQTLGQYPTGDITNTKALGASLNWIVRNHTLKFGADIRDIMYISQNYGNALGENFDNTWTQANYAQSDASSGNAIASMLLGTPTSGSSAYNSLGVFTNHYIAPWIQDDWRITKKLTLNLGLRWDLNTPYTERFNRIDRGFNATAPSPLNQLVNGSQFPGFTNLTGGLQFAGVNGVSRNAADIYYGAIQPRVGAAYSLNRKMVIRGGWGRYYINPSNNYTQTTGFNVSTPMIVSNNGGITPIANVLNNPLPTGLNLPPGASQGLDTFVGQGLTVVNSKFLLPHTDQFSFGVQYQVSQRSKFEVSYVGNRGGNLESAQTINGSSNIPLSLRKQCDAYEGGSSSYCQALLPNPFFGLAPFAGTSYYTSPTLSRATLSDPYPQFGTITSDDQNHAASWYNSVQTSYEVRMKNGLTLIANYTFSKMVYQNGYNDILTLTPERSIYQYDEPHNVNLTGIWDLPFGQGRRWGANTHGFVGHLVSGWEATTIFNYHSGLPWKYPSNFIYVKNAQIKHPNFSSPLVQGVTPCVANWGTNGQITMEAYSVKDGCTNYNFLIEPLMLPQPSRPIAGKCGP